jgi:hypothetical protein
MFVHSAHIQNTSERMFSLFYQKQMYLFSLILVRTITTLGARGSVVGLGTMLQAGTSRVRVQMRCIFFFNLPNPSSRTMTLRSTQPLTEMSTRDLPGG